MPLQKRSLDVLDALIILPCFLVIVTWLDWLGFFSMLIAGFGVVTSQIIYLGLALLMICIAVAILKTKRYSAMQRAVLILGLVWLLVLPFIPWSDEKVMITRSALLVRGMTKAQVQAIMTSRSVVQMWDDKGTELAFCTEINWTHTQCRNDTFVLVTIQDDQLVSVAIDWD